MKSSLKFVIFGLVGLFLTGEAWADFTETFDTFTLGTLTAQQDWEAHALIDVVATTSDGFYTGGRALESNSYDDKTSRHDATGVDFDLTKNHPGGYEFGYDTRSDNVADFTMRMYLRRDNLTRYSPTAGFRVGEIILRPQGEGGTEIFGNDFASAAFYGAGTAEDPGYWEKGDWLRIKVTLNGTDNEMVTVRAFNLSRNNLEIPTGLTNVDMTSTATFIDGYWTRFNFRSGTDGVLVDNAYVIDSSYEEPIPDRSGVFVSLIGQTPLIPEEPLDPAVVYYVATNGIDTALGDEEHPLASLNEAVARVRIAIEDNDWAVPEGGAVVWVKGGLYNYSTTLNFNSVFQGTAGAPVVIRAMPGEVPVFDGSVPLDPALLSTVTDPTTLARLHPGARGDVVSMVVTDSTIAARLAGRTNLNLDGRMMRKSRFPNSGFVHIDTIFDEGAIYAAGRTPGDPPTYSWENPIGGVFSLQETHGGNWEAELEQSQAAVVQGYLSYDWYKETHKMASYTNSQIKLLEYSRYGVINPVNPPRRLVVFGLLCELDQPGEWFFDETDQTLYLYPFDPIDANTTIGVWAGGTFANFNGCSHVTVRGLTISGGGNLSAVAIVRMINGHHNLLAGCTVKNSERLAIKIEGGQFNGIQSCDVYDVVRHIRTEGGDVKTLTPTGNYIDNCHFTQVQASDYKGSVELRGVGDRLSHCLVHNLPTQPITPSGNLQDIEYNEVFNVGFEEGDGGVMYNANAVWSGYGQTFKGNFLHNIICVPGLHSRGGIYLDQLYGGAVIENNVFYKCAHRAILINGGAGVDLKNNLILDGYYGYYNTDVYAAQIYLDKPKYDSGELTRGDVNDYYWRIEQAVGTNGWNQSPWLETFPEFAELMNNYPTCFYPVLNVVETNYFADNTQNIVFNHGGSQLYDMATTNYLGLGTGGIQSVSMTQFPKADVLNFYGILSPDAVFNTDAAGLVLDQYRTTMPNKDSYRSTVRQHFEGIPSYDPSAVYDPEVNAARRINTGKLFFP